MKRTQTMTDSKITSSHLQRRALVYVRQSTPSQVANHRDSTRRQYALAERAQELGWHGGEITVIDDDLGLSGASADGRGGFARAIAEVAHAAPRTRSLRLRRSAAARSGCRARPRSPCCIRAVTPALADGGYQLPEVFPLDRLEFVRDTVQVRVFRRVGADGLACASGVAVVASEARTVSLEAETGKKHLRLVAGAAAIKAHGGRRERDADDSADRLEVLVDEVVPVVVQALVAIPDAGVFFRGVGGREQRLLVSLGQGPDRREGFAAVLDREPVERQVRAVFQRGLARRPVREVCVVHAGVGPVRGFLDRDVEGVVVVARREHGAAHLEPREVEGGLEVAGELRLDQRGADRAQIVGEPDADARLLARLRLAVAWRRHRRRDGRAGGVNVRTGRVDAMGRRIRVMAIAGVRAGLAGLRRLRHVLGLHQPGDDLERAVMGDGDDAACHREVLAAEHHAGLDAALDLVEPGRRPRSSRN